ncbi:hypothetical protein INT48_006079 [Thamnidium elegans]|uniref:tRNA-splicing endonuclease subunit Sen54 N-terminal domain-containing protein n=1 Tax=Thamnidium elegans TaxID=101142 RepID=A0A8H7VVT1_9FUNG|nr:hypothetical protein INT48_006079 [Thamnidium elegans]
MSDEEDEELLDYSRLLKKTRAPKRGNKSTDTTTELDQRSVEITRNALFECIQVKPNLPKQCSRGQLNQLSTPYWTTITVSKGTHLRTVGFANKGMVTLFPEEAAFLVSRDALVVTNQDDQVLKFQDFCMMLCDQDTDGWITFDKYQVYAYLKRLGYIVLRSKYSVPVTKEIDSPDNTTATSLWDLFCRYLSCWIYKNNRLPLVWDYKYSSYREIYSTLQIIPSSPWYKPFYKSLCRTFDWDVYKPTSSFKKKEPGVPDFRVIVNNIHDHIPSLHEQNQLFSQLVGVPNNSYQPVKNTELKEFGGGPTFVMALVGDAEGVSFLRMIGDGLADIA